MHESVSGSRKIRRSSKKGSKKGSKKSSRMDFSGLLDDMENEPMMQQQNQGHQMQQMQQMQMQMPGMQMPGMQMPGMQMPGMGMDPLAMAQMAMPQMGMPQMMMGNTPEEVDPLHIQHFVPQNQNTQIDNYGVNANQLMSGSQISQQFRGREMSAPQMAAPQQMGGGHMFTAYDSFINKFM